MLPALGATVAAPQPPCAQELAAAHRDGELARRAYHAIGPLCSGRAHMASALATPQQGEEYAQAVPEAKLGGEYLGLARWAREILETGVSQFSAIKFYLLFRLRKCTCK